MPVFAVCSLSGAAPAQSAPAAGELEVVRPVVVARYPHDPEAFTQGLLFDQGWLYESTGLTGRSSLRRVEVDSGEVLQQATLEDAEFGEGLALVERRLVQLTWQNQVAHVYDLESFEEIESFHYEGEGWGLCFDGQRLVMSDGSNLLFFRDPDSFELLGTVEVTLAGEPVERLNELECVNGVVYANIWLSNTIVRIDPDTGTVIARVDASSMLTPEEQARADVLNGIAHEPNSDRFYLTGKLWPWTFVVELPFDKNVTGPSSNDPQRNEEADDAGSSRRVAGCSLRSGTVPPISALLLLALLLARRLQAETREKESPPARRKAAAIDSR